MDWKVLRDLHKFSSRNRQAIRKSYDVGCFFCLEMFPVTEVKEWIKERDGRYTGLCPGCGIDSLLPRSKVVSYLTKEGILGDPDEPYALSWLPLLSEMKEYWFSVDYRNWPTKVHLFAIRRNGTKFHSSMCWDHQNPGKAFNVGKINDDSKQNASIVPGLKYVWLSRRPTRKEGGL